MFLSIGTEPINLLPIRKEQKKYSSLATLKRFLLYFPAIYPPTTQKYFIFDWDGAVQVRTSQKMRFSNKKVVNLKHGKGILILKYTSLCISCLNR